VTKVIVRAVINEPSGSVCRSTSFAASRIEALHPATAPILDEGPETVDHRETAPGPRAKFRARPDARFFPKKKFQIVTTDSPYRARMFKNEVGWYLPIRPILESAAPMIVGSTANCGALSGAMPII
jgi:hypothetical protein